MGKWLRSAEMQYVSLIVQDHVAHDCAERVGDIGAMQFVDLNGEMTAFQRRYTPYVRRCDQLERVIRFFEAEMDRLKVNYSASAAATGAPGLSEADDDVEFERWLAMEQTRARRAGGGGGGGAGAAAGGTGGASGGLLDVWEAELTRQERELLSMNEYRDGLLRAFISLLERRYVIVNVQDLFAVGAGAEQVAELRGDAELERERYARAGAARRSKDDDGFRDLHSPVAHSRPLLDSAGAGAPVMSHMDVGISLGGGVDPEVARKRPMPSAPPATSSQSGGLEAKPGSAGAGDGDAEGDADAGFGSFTMSMPLPSSAATPGGASGGPASAVAVASARSVDRSMSFQHVAGVILRDDRVGFERMVWRISRGNCYCKFVDIDDPIETEEGGGAVTVYKCVFVVMFRAESLATKLRRLMDAFNAHRYALPDFEDARGVQREVRVLEADIEAAARVLTEHQRTARMSLERLSRVLRHYRRGVQREKGVYHVLNLFHTDMSGMLRAQGWVLAEKVDAVRDAIQDVHARAGGGASVPSYLHPVEGKWPMPPTHYEINKFTSVFQETVNTYGIPRYREMNPAVWTTVSFPFLFGVMYGDIGHAGFIFVGALLMVLFESRVSRMNLGEMGGMLFAGRYMLVLMGLFGIYAGFVYNDCFALGLNLFGTRYRLPVGYDNNVEGGSGSAAAGGGTNGTRVVQRMWRPDRDDVYGFGVDPSWHIAQNDLTYFNSLKMKMSVILGLTQMLFGLALKTSNALHFRSKVDLLCECLPQVIFLLAFFGNMVFLIVLKWSIDWNDPPPPAVRPPSLIDTLIGMVLSPGTVKDPLYSGQAGVQVMLLLVAFICIPWMLLVKPLLLRRWHRQATAASGGADRSQYTAHGGLAGLDDLHGSHQRLSMPGLELGGLGSTGSMDLESESDVPPSTAMGDEGHDVSAAAGVGASHGEEFDFEEIVIHQTIETIEFVLGSVSHTASYLRLWALSLAHSQLATVFWERAFMVGASSGPVMAFLGYGAFAGATTGVLLMMDVLECFLHALRLHWVEFQSKFFHADGVLFVPFNLAKIAKKGADA